LNNCYGNTQTRLIIYPVADLILRVLPIFPIVGTKNILRQVNRSAI